MPVQENRRPVYPGIDLIKFLCTLLVIFVHTESRMKENPLTFYFCASIVRIAVPFFFAVSAFFVFRKTDPEHFEWTPTFRFSGKILRLLGLWTILLCNSRTYQLWYLKSVFVAVLLVSLMVQNRLSLRKIFLISMLLYVIGLSADTYYGLLGKPIMQFEPINHLVHSLRFFSDTTRNGIFMAPIFIFIGLFMAYRPIKLNQSRIIPGLLVSLILLIGETVIVTRCGLVRDRNMYLSLIPVTFFLLCFAIQLRLPDPQPFAALRAIGVLMFFIHLFVAHFYYMLADFLVSLGAPAILNAHSFLFIAIAGISFLISLWIYSLSRKERFNWLKYLYS